MPVLGSNDDGTTNPNGMETRTPERADPSIPSIHISDGHSLETNTSSSVSSPSPPQQQEQQQQPSRSINIKKWLGSHPTVDEKQRDDPDEELATHDQDNGMVPQQQQQGTINRNPLSNRPPNHPESSSSTTTTNNVRSTQQQHPDGTMVLERSFEKQIQSVVQNNPSMSIGDAYPRNNLTSYTVDDDETDNPDQELVVIHKQETKNKRKADEDTTSYTDLEEPTEEGTGHDYDDDDDDNYDHDKDGRSPTKEWKKNPRTTLHVGDPTSCRRPPENPTRWNNPEQARSTVGTQQQQQQQQQREPTKQSKVATTASRSIIAWIQTMFHWFPTWIFLFVLVAVIIVVLPVMTSPRYKNNNKNG